VRRQFLEAVGQTARDWSGPLADQHDVDELLLERQV
jgi:hypothetical protein